MIWLTNLMPTPLLTYAPKTTKSYSLSFRKATLARLKHCTQKNNGMQVEVTMTSAPASDAMKMLVVERMP